MHTQDNSLKKLTDSFPSIRGKKVYTWTRRTEAFSPDGRKALTARCNLLEDIIDCANAKSTQLMAVYEFLILTTVKGAAALQKMRN